MKYVITYILSTLTVAMLLLVHYYDTVEPLKQEVNWLKDRYANIGHIIDNQNKQLDLVMEAVNNSKEPLTQ